MTQINDKEARWLLKEKYQGLPSPEYEADLKQLREGVPLAYLIGWVDFLGCRIDLAAHPLIPRPETEWWCERVIDMMRKEGRSTPKILDLFAGSGCIGIAILRHVPKATVDFGEIDPVLCDAIRENVRGNGTDTNRARIIATDIFASITDRYDYILANPPYIDPNARETVEGSVIAHEPHDALFANEGGVSALRNLIENAPAHLHNGGKLVSEFGKGQEKSVADLLQNNGYAYEINEDQYGVPRWFVATPKPLA